jgi:HK97 family phage portal protein
MKPNLIDRVWDRLLTGRKDSVTSIDIQGGRQDRDNFVTNRISINEFDDRGDGGALGLSTTWACTTLLAGLTGSLPFQIFKPGGNGVSVLDATHALYYLLHSSPNADDTAMEFWEFIAGCIELRGHAYAEKKFIGDRLVSLTPIDPALVSRRKEGGKWIYSWTVSGKANEVTADKMFHVRGPFGGMTPLTICRKVFGGAVSVENSATSTFRNGARPTGVLSSDKNFTPDQRKLAEDLIQQRYSGAVNSGKPLLLDGGVKWEQLSINPDDAQMLESRKFSVEEICRIFGVPPHMIGHTEGSTSWGTGLEQQTLGFLTFTFRRRLKRIEQAVAKQLLTDADRARGITVSFNIDALLRADSGARSKYYQVMSQIGAMTINEIRALENLPSVAGGDIPRVQMQNQPIGSEAPAEEDGNDAAVQE